MCKHPCVCADMCAGLSNHTIWQRGKRSSGGIEFSTRDDVRPKPPGAVEEMVGMASKHLVEELLGHKHGEGDTRAQLRYE